MRGSFADPPTRDELLGLSLNEVVRRWPETLAVFDGAGVSLVSWGGDRLSSLDDVEDRLAADLLAATSWRDRGQAGSGKR